VRRYYRLTDDGRALLTDEASGSPATRGLHLPAWESSLRDRQNELFGGSHVASTAQILSTRATSR